MVTKNKKIIGLTILLFSITLFAYILFISKEIFTGTQTSAIVTGFKISRNGANKVAKNATKIWNGRSPFVKFKTTNADSIETYSKVSQLTSLISYRIGDNVIINYNTNNPKQIFILNPKEIPGIALLIIFVILAFFVGKSFLK